MKARKNALYAQSGGVTSVINSSAYGVILQLKETQSDALIYAAKDGILGIINDNVYDLQKTQKPLNLLLNSPAGMFGSCRYKLPEITEKEFYNKMFEKLDKRSIKYIFYNGGNDSADTCLKIALAAKGIGYDLNAIAVPKTIDNDLIVTDNCPGFGSVAKYVATSAMEASLDLKSMCKTSTKVFVLEVMGRHAGWIAAAAELANTLCSDIYVHKILLPEVPFNEEKFLQGVESDISKFGYSVIVASEGLKDSNGNLYSEAGQKDSFGHSQLGGLSPKIAKLIKDKIGLKYHWAVSDYLQRSARHLSSMTDIEQAIAVGRYAVDFALSGKTGIMPVIKRVSNDPYRWEIAEGDLSEIANQEKLVPDNYIAENKFRINSSGIAYLKPLIQGESFPDFFSGLPKYEQLDLHLA